MRGLVIKKNADLFHVRSGDQVFFCNARGNLKKDGLFVGDKVNFNKKEYIIENIIQRKNLLVRPPIANLDNLLIVVAPKPEPDLYLVDKLILFCFVNGINPILCINKKDLDANFVNKIYEIYSPIVKTIKVSALENDIQDLEKEITGISAFAGQSAVGKSSLINSIFHEEKEKIGEFAKKVERGKQTTRTVTLYKFGNGYIADTAGFSKLFEDLIDVEINQISRYYPDFMPFIPMCKYRSCLHDHGDQCGVIKAVEDGQIAISRYENYLKLIEFKKNQKRG